MGDEDDDFADFVSSEASLTSSAATLTVPQTLESNPVVASLVSHSASAPSEDDFGDFTFGSTTTGQETREAPQPEESVGSEEKPPPATAPTAATESNSAAAQSEDDFGEFSFEAPSSNDAISSSIQASQNVSNESSARATTTSDEAPPPFSSAPVAASLATAVTSHIAPSDDDFGEFSFESAQPPTSIDNNGSSSDSTSNGSSSDSQSEPLPPTTTTSTTTSSFFATTAAATDEGSTTTTAAVLLSSEAAAPSEDDFGEFSFEAPAPIAVAANATNASSAGDEVTNSANSSVIPSSKSSASTLFVGADTSSTSTTERDETETVESCAAATNVAGSLSSSTFETIESTPPGLHSVTENSPRVASAETDDDDDFGEFAQEENAVAAPPVSTSSFSSLTTSSGQDAVLEQNHTTYPTSSPEVSSTSETAAGDASNVEVSTSSSSVATTIMQPSTTAAIVPPMISLTLVNVQGVEEDGGEEGDDSSSIGSTEVAELEETMSNILLPISSHTPNSMTRSGASQASLSGAFLRSVEGEQDEDEDKTPGSKNGEEGGEEEEEELGQFVSAASAPESNSNGQSGVSWNATNERIKLEQSSEDNDHHKSVNLDDFGASSSTSSSAPSVSSSSSSSSSSAPSSSPASKPSPPSSLFTFHRLPFVAPPYLQAYEVPEVNEAASQQQQQQETRLPPFRFPGPTAFERKFAAILASKSSATGKPSKHEFLRKAIEVSLQEVSEAVIANGGLGYYRLNIPSMNATTQPHQVSSGSAVDANFPSSDAEGDGWADFSSTSSTTSATLPAQKTTQAASPFQFLTIPPEMQVSLDSSISGVGPSGSETSAQATEKSLQALLEPYHEIAERQKQEALSQRVDERLNTASSANVKKELLLRDAINNALELAVSYKSPSSMNAADDVHPDWRPVPRALVEANFLPRPIPIASNISLRRNNLKRSISNESEASNSGSNSSSNGSKGIAAGEAKRNKKVTPPISSSASSMDIGPSLSLDAFVNGGTSTQLAASTAATSIHATSSKTSNAAVTRVSSATSASTILKSAPSSSASPSQSLSTSEVSQLAALLMSSFEESLPDLSALLRRC